MGWIDILNLLSSDDGLMYKYTISKKNFGMEEKICFVISAVRS